MSYGLPKDAVQHAELELIWNKIKQYLDTHSIEPVELVRLLADFENKFQNHVANTSYFDKEALQAKLRKEHGIMWDGNGHTERISQEQANAQAQEAVADARLNKDVEGLLSWKDGIIKIIYSSIGGIVLALLGVGISYGVLTTKMDTIEAGQMANTKFRTDWPLGRLGTLPDDQIQTTKIDALERKAKEVENKIGKINERITADYIELSNKISGN